jgi:hypothetical protein
MLPYKTVWALAIAIGTGCTAQQDEVQREVSFKTDVQPVLEHNCVICHHPGAEGYKANGLDLTSYASLMKGKASGPVIEPGSSSTSILVRAVNRDANPPIVMPHRNPPLPKKDIKILQAWVDQGARDN